MKSTEQKHSILVNWFDAAMEWGNRWLTLSHFIFSPDKHIFRKIELMLLLITVLSVTLIFAIHLLPTIVAWVVSILLIQRIAEFVIVYSRNFILGRGRIFTMFHDETKLGEWLIVMFGLNLIQIVSIFAIWYRLLSLNNSNSFNMALSAWDSLYFSVVTFLTLGYGDIAPQLPLPKGVVIFQGMLTFYIVVIAINGLISIHFRK